MSECSNRNDTAPLCTARASICCRAALSLPIKSCGTYSPKRETLFGETVGLGMPFLRGPSGEGLSFSITKKPATPDVPQPCPLFPDHKMAALVKSARFLGVPAKKYVMHRIASKSPARGRGAVPSATSLSAARRGTSCESPCKRNIGLPS